MYELIPVGERTYYIDCPAKMGLYRYDGDRVCLIDSGGGGDAARKVIRHLEEQGWTLTHIFNTHSHADHVGGNALLQRRLGVPAYAWGIEVPFICEPVMEPMVLFGAYPYREIRNKFLQAKPSDCKPLTEDVLPEGLTFTTLCGHAAGMVGYRTGDGVWFVADTVLSEETLEKYHVSYLYDVAGYLESLEKLETLEGRLFIPSHAGPTADLRPLVGKNRAKALEVAELVLTLCERPRTVEQIIKAVFDHYGLKMVHNQYATSGAALRSYLAYLRDQKRLEAFFENNYLYWRRTETI